MGDASLDRRFVAPSAWRLLGMAVLVVAVVAGLVGRLWLLHIEPLSSDEAVVGLMAEQIRHGHFSTFYWGQQYGGVEPYVVAVVTGVAGHSPLVLNFVPTLLWAVACVFMWRAGLYLLPEGWGAAAIAVAVAMWVASPMAYFSNTRELGLHGITVALGVALVWAGLRIGRSHRPADYVLLGLLSGLGWWSSPEMAYFVLPAAAAIVSATGPLRPVRWPAVGAAVGGFLLGAAPWIFANLQSGFASLDAGSAPGRGQSSFFGRLGIFFTKSLPLELGLRNALRFTWLFGRLGEVIYVLVLAGLAALCLAVFHWRWGTANAPNRRVALLMVAGMLLFPFEYAALPATWYWRDGRYAIYVIPLLAFVALVSAPLVGGWIERLVARRHMWARAPVLSGATWLTAVGVVSVCSFSVTFLNDDPANITRGWGNPDAAVQASTRVLARTGDRYAVADYWTAYTVDYLSRGSLQVTSTRIDRWPAQHRTVLAQPEYGVLFFSPADYWLARIELGTVPGPYGFNETTFIAALQKGHVPYSLVRAGALDEVVLKRQAR